MSALDLQHSKFAPLIKTPGAREQIVNTICFAINPNMLMIAGGTDYVEREIALSNAELISSQRYNKPIVYCGNIENREEIKEIFEGQ